MLAFNAGFEYLSLADVFRDSGGHITSYLSTLACASSQMPAGPAFTNESSGGNAIAWSFSCASSWPAIAPILLSGLWFPEWLKLQAASRGLLVFTRPDHHRFNPHDRRCAPHLCPRGQVPPRPIRNPGLLVQDGASHRSHIVAH